MASDFDFDCYCSECGAAEPDWNGLHADPGSLSNENEALRAALICARNQDGFLDFPRYVRELIESTLER